MIDWLQKWWALVVAAVLGALGILSLRRAKVVAVGPSETQKKSDAETHRAIEEAEKKHDAEVARAGEEKDQAVVLVRDTIVAKAAPVLEDDRALNDYLKQTGKEVHKP